MQYRRLGEAGVKVSEIGLGGWLTFANVLDDEAARAILHKAFEVGVNFFDTANVYAEGQCEMMWGRILRDVPRESLVLATKVYFPVGSGPNDRGLSRKHIVEQCEASLRRLGMTYIDLYQCHRFDEHTPLEETVRAMDDLIRQGKVLYWGFSQWMPEQIQKCLQVCGDRLEKPRSSQPQYNLLQRFIEPQVMPLCAKAGIGQMAYSPLAQGVLTGKYKPEHKPPPDSRAADGRQNQFIGSWFGIPGVLEKVQRLGSLAEQRSCTLAQLALAWILRRSEVTCCITGATRPRQIEENAEASGIKLDEETVRRMEEIVA